MIRWIVKSSLSLSYLIIVLAVVLLVFGALQIRTMPVDVYPEFDPPLVEVQTEALGLSAAEVESLLTVPIEADLLNGVAWLDQIYSESVAGLSSILLVFKPGTDPIRARQMVQERLTQTFALPNVSQPPNMLQPLSTNSRAMIVGISSDELSLLDLGVLARWTIKPRLMGVPGVANVAVWGHRDRQLQVLVDPVQLAAQDVSIFDVIETTGESLWVSPLSYLEASSPGTAGWIDTPNQRLTIQHELPISSAEDLAQVTIEGREGLLLGDVARVVEDHQPLIGDASLNNQSGLLLVIEKLPGANTLEVTKGIEDALTDMTPGLKGVKIDNSIYRPANYIESMVSNLGTGMMISLVLLAIALGLFLFNWRTVLISLIVIPLSLITAIFVLNLRGEPFNVMTLTGLALLLGVIIDNVVVDVDNIALHVDQHRQNGEKRSIRATITNAILETRQPLSFALLILLLFSVPIFLIPGLRGTFFRPLVTTYVIALLTSFLVAVIVTPALSLILFANAPESKPSPILGTIQNAVGGLLGRIVQTPMLGLAAGGVMLLLGLLAWPLLNTSLQTDFQQSELLIDWDAVPGTSRVEMNRLTANITQDLEAIPGVSNVGSHIGRAITGDAVVGINSGEFWVSLDSSINYNTTISSINEAINAYAGVDYDVHTYQPERTTQALNAATNEVTVRVYGYEYDVLATKAAEISQRIQSVSGVASVHSDPLIEEPQISIAVDLIQAEANQVKPGDVRRQATTLLSGLQVGNLYEENKVFDVVVWGVPEIRRNLSDIEQLMISTPKGLVPLTQLADVSIEPAPLVIKRDVVSRFADVVVTLDGRSVTAAAPDIRDAVRSIEYPLEYHAELIDLPDSTGGIQQNMVAIVLATLLAALLLMQAAYRSWSLALTGLLASFAAVSGGLIATLLSGGTLGVGALFGLLGVLALAIRNSMLTLSHVRTLRMQADGKYNADLVIQAIRDRIPSILLTAVATLLVFLPFLLRGSIAGYEMLHPMAVVMTGGLITSTLVNLFVIPALYLRFGGSVEEDVNFDALSADSDYVLTVGTD